MFTRSVKGVLYFFLMFGGICYLQASGDVTMEYFPAIPRGENSDSIVSVSGAGDWYVMLKRFE